MENGVSGAHHWPQTLAWDPETVVDGSVAAESLAWAVLVDPVGVPLDPEVGVLLASWVLFDFVASWPTFLDWVQGPLFVGVAPHCTGVDPERSLPQAVVHQVDLKAVKKLLPHQRDWVDSTDFVVLKFAVVTILVADWGVAHPVAVAHLVDRVEAVAVVPAGLR